MMDLLEIGINSHIHTPYSFSAFSSMNQIFDMADKENVKVLGISDFYTDDGYVEYYRLAKEHKVYPIFCMEYIGLFREKQEQNIRVNDPNNPGRTYLCGKAFGYPFTLNKKYSEKLAKLILESQDQAKAMVLKANAYFVSIGLPFVLDFEEIKQKYAKNMVRERHIARAIRIAVCQKSKTEKECRDMVSLILETEIDEAMLKQDAYLENLIRSRLLKKGGYAFVEETESAFLPVSELIGLIVNGKGIPCYPVLLDDQSRNYTEFEKDWEQLYSDLVGLGIFAIELIPFRNDPQILKKFVNFFNKRNFIITFGTEHNTPDIIPLTVLGKDGQPLDDELRKIGLNGACVLAAHQHLVAEGKEGYLDSMGIAKSYQFRDFVSLGKDVLQNFLTY